MSEEDQVSAIEAAEAIADYDGTGAELEVTLKREATRAARLRRQREEEIEFVSEMQVRKGTPASLAPLALRHAGWSYEEIAIHQGLADAKAAKKAVDEAVMLHLQGDAESREMSRALLVSRIEKMTTNTWRDANNPNSPKQLEAGRNVLKYLQEIAKLTGAYAPTEHNVSSPALDRIEQIVAQLAPKSEVEEKDIFGDDIVDAEVIEDEPEGIEA